ncbi:MAG: ferritin-like domain-containing protein [Ferruginibacter sp.]
MATKTKKAPTKSSKVPAKADAAGDLKKLLEDEIKDIYWAEKALTKALPKMAKNATAPELKKAITDHLAQTLQHVKRLEDCFAALGKKVQAKKCDAMAGILEEANGILEETKPGAVRDAGIIAASQKAEHYEIATYGTMAAWAKVLEEKDCLKLFLQTLGEEKAADELLTSIADTNLNTEAMK